MSWILKALETFRRILGEIDPTLNTASPTLRSLSSDRAELSWQGKPFVFDRRANTILRAGRVVAGYDAVRSIEIVERKDKDSRRGSTWSVILEIGFPRNVVVGITRDQTDASVAAAHVATVTGKRVEVS